MIHFVNVSKVYINKIKAIDKVTVKIEKGEFTFLVGPSGAGKSTFIRLLFREELPTSGQIVIAGRSVIRLRRREVAALRRKMGIVFQDFRLLSERTAFENVALALEVLELPPREVSRRSEAALERVGLRGKGRFYPHQLSGGEQQRVAIARAVVNNPPIVVADEPTGNLDPEASREVVSLLKGLHERGTTVILATHAWDIVNDLRQRVIALDGGRVIRDDAGGAYYHEG